MPVPEAPVHEHSGAVLRKQQVGLPDQGRMKSESQAGLVEVSPESELRLGVLTPDPGHHPASGFPIDDVRHGQAANICF